MALRSQLTQLETDKKQSTENILAKEKALEKAFDERLHIELRQQQLRYDRRLSVRSKSRHSASVAFLLTNEN